MTTFSNIGGAEPSTLTFKVGTVLIARGSTNEHQEILVLGDPQSSLGLAQVVAAPPASTTFGLAVRIVSGPSSGSDYVTQIQGNSTVIQGTSPWVVGGNSTSRLNIGSTAADNVVTIGGVLPRFNIGSTAADNVVTLGGVLPRLNIGSTAADNAVLISGDSTVVQGTSPWVVGGNSTSRLNIGSTAADNVVTIAGVLPRFNIGSTAADNVVTIGAVSARMNIGSTAADNVVTIAGVLPRFNIGSTAADNAVTVAGNSTVHFAKASTSARASITQSSTSVTMQSSNASRLGWSCFNNPTQNANLYLKFGAATASTTDFDVRLPAFGYYEMPQPITSELIVGVWDSTGVGFARVREVLP